MARAVRCGAPLSVAARACGIRPATARAWMRRGATGEEPYHSFLAALSRARAQGIAFRVRQIHRRAAKNWRAAAWLLERQSPQHFGRPEKPRQAPAAPPVQIDLAPYLAMIRELPPELLPPPPTQAEGPGEGEGSP
jgi:hypothetical protein